MIATTLTTALQLRKPVSHQPANQPAIQPANQPANQASHRPSHRPEGLPPAGAAVLAATALVWPALAGRRWGPQRLVAGLWYRMLRKPSFQPPDLAIPLAWGLIDSALTLAGYRLLRKPSAAPPNRALGLWALNVGLIGGWSGVFFGRRNLPASTVLAAAMVGSGVAYVAQARKVDLPAASAGVPFVVWVGFAAVLTAALWRKND